MLLRLFLALLPPRSIQAEIAEIQKYFSDRYDSRAALRSPPHITLQAPFTQSPENIAILHKSLKEFAHNFTTVPITLNGFAAFAPRVIYVDVVQSPALMAIQTELAQYMGTKVGIRDENARTRPFKPHVTVAFRDLSKPNFQAAWTEFKTRSISFEFDANFLTLLQHDGRRWHINAEFPFNSP
ncbi:2'-5' RNA ligase family protein [Pseudanabaena sp. PCC 6802]|uniref:2'-5' RNA ligase family protein n=1 Tax=Pseudanabaena sp. PCC 6802 TaxID=118173 RepID=UPI00034D0C02|nr:2'-5' RNA ligase family protein [Pseudanabaena sp. PCC 6802]